MKIKAIALGLALVSLAHSARAEGTFSALEGIPAQRLSAQELDAVEAKGFLVVNGRVWRPSLFSWYLDDNLVRSLSQSTYLRMIGFSGYVGTPNCPTCHQRVW